MVYLFMQAGKGPLRTRASQWARTTHKLQALVSKPPFGPMGFCAILVSRVLGARVPGAWGREPDELPVSFFVWYGIPSVYPP